MIRLRTVVVCNCPSDDTPVWRVLEIAGTRQPWTFREQSKVQTNCKPGGNTQALVTVGPLRKPEPNGFGGCCRHSALTSLSQVNATAHSGPRHPTATFATDVLDTCTGFALGQILPSESPPYSLHIVRMPTCSGDDSEGNRRSFDAI